MKHYAQIFNGLCLALLTSFGISNIAEANAKPTSIPAPIIAQSYTTTYREDADGVYRPVVVPTQAISDTTPDATADPQTAPADSNDNPIPSGSSTRPIIIPPRNTTASHDNEVVVTSNAPQAQVDIRRLLTINYHLVSTSSGYKVNSIGSVPANIDIASDLPFGQTFGYVSSIDETVVDGVHSATPKTNSAFVGWTVTLKPEPYATPNYLLVKLSVKLSELVKVTKGVYHEQNTVHTMNVALKIGEANTLKLPWDDTELTLEVTPAK